MDMFSKTCLETVFRWLWTFPVLIGESIVILLKFPKYTWKHAKASASQLKINNAWEAQKPQLWAYKVVIYNRFYVLYLSCKADST